jgi:hypothetical protein
MARQFGCRQVHLRVPLGAHRRVVTDEPKVAERIEEPALR